MTEVVKSSGRFFLDLRVGMLEVLEELLKQVHSLTCSCNLNMTDRHCANQVTDTPAHDLSSLATVETCFIHVADNFSDSLANRAPLRHLGLERVLSRDITVDLRKLTPVITLYKEL